MPYLVLEAGNIKEHWLCCISKDIKKFNHAGIKGWGGDMIIFLLCKINSKMENG